MTTPADLQRLSKFLSLLLRHEPSAVGVVLDAEGWVGRTSCFAAAEV